MAKQPRGLPGLYCLCMDKELPFWEIPPQKLWWTTKCVKLKIQQEWFGLWGPLPIYFAPNKGVPLLEMREKWDMCSLGWFHRGSGQWVSRQHSPTLWQEAWQETDVKERKGKRRHCTRTRGVKCTWHWEQSQLSLFEGTTATKREPRDKQARTHGQATEGHTESGWLKTGPSPHIQRTRSAPHPALILLHTWWGHCIALDPEVDTHRTVNTRGNSLLFFFSLVCFIFPFLDVFLFFSFLVV